MPAAGHPEQVPGPPPLPAGYPIFYSHTGGTARQTVISWDRLPVEGEPPPRLRVQVHIPEVQSSIAEVEVCVLDYCMEVFPAGTEDAPPLVRVNFPLAVDCENSRATFLRKKKALVLKVPVNLAPPPTTPALALMLSVAAAAQRPCSALRHVAALATPSPRSLAALASLPSFRTEAAGVALPASTPSASLSPLSGPYSEEPQSPQRDDDALADPRGLARNHSERTRAALQRLPSERSCAALQRLPSERSCAALQRLPSERTAAAMVRLPSERTVAALTRLPSDRTVGACIRLPSDRTLGAWVPLPSDRTTAAAHPLPSDRTIAAAHPLPSERTYATMVALPSDRTVGAAVDLPESPGVERVRVRAYSLRTHAALCRLPSVRTMAADVWIPSTPRASVRTYASTIVLPDMLAAAGVLQCWGRCVGAKAEAERRRIARSGRRHPRPRGSWSAPAAEEVLMMQRFARRTISGSYRTRMLLRKRSFGLLMKQQRERPPQPPLCIPARALEEQELAFTALQSHMRRKLALREIVRRRVARDRGLWARLRATAYPLAVHSIEEEEEPACAAIQRRWRCYWSRAEREARAAAAARGGPVRRCRPCPRPTLLPSAPLEEQEEAEARELARRRAAERRGAALLAAVSAAPVALGVSLVIRLQFVPLRLLLRAAAWTGRAVRPLEDGTLHLQRPQTGLQALRHAAAADVANNHHQRLLQHRREMAELPAVRPNTGNSRSWAPAQALPRPSSAPLARPRPVLREHRTGPARPLPPHPGSPCGYRWTQPPVFAAATEADPGAKLSLAERRVLLRVEHAHREWEEGAVPQRRVDLLWGDVHDARQGVCTSEQAERCVLGRMHLLWSAELSDRRTAPPEAASDVPVHELKSPPPPCRTPASRPLSGGWTGRLLGKRPMSTRPTSAATTTAASPSHCVYSSYASYRTPERLPQSYRRKVDVRAPDNAVAAAEAATRAAVEDAEWRTRDRALMQLSVTLSRIRKGRRLVPGARPIGGDVESPRSRTVRAALQVAQTAELERRAGMAAREQELRDRASKRYLVSTKQLLRRQRNRADEVAPAAAA
eukprot:TRINITY_DN18674_c1_g1_i1.p1 TRINITY_DN18674_c1_g1~~TRINITY_DN18674_c1_g1_i1.p1  ORF type:complete len:1107 (+),score=157.92 TRINITY_DN18674_c1_g1_i1:120-3323(+)